TGVQTCALPIWTAHLGRGPSTGTRAVLRRAARHLHHPGGPVPLGGDPLPRGQPDPHRLVLRRERVPHHHAAARRGEQDRRHRPPALLGPPHPPAVPGDVLDDRRLLGAHARGAAHRTGG